MNEEELLRLYLAQQAQTNPLAYDLNDWGQGPGYLGLEDKPSSFARADNMGDLVYDQLRSAGVDFNEFMAPIAGEYVRRPELDDPYVSDSSFLYQGNPVYQEIQRQVSNGLSLDQAINKIKTAYSKDPAQFQGMLPTVTESNFQSGVQAGDPDWAQVASGAQDFLTEGRKEQNSQSEYDRAMAEYLDATRPRTQYEVAGSPQFADIRSQYAQQYGWDDPRIQYQELNPGARPAAAPRVPMNLDVENGGGNLIPGLTAGFGAGRVNMTPDRITSLTRNPLAANRAAQASAQAAANAEAIRNSPDRPLVGGIRGRGENQYMGSSVVKRDDTEERFRKAFESGIREAKARQMSSKNEEVLAKLIAARAGIIYGQA